jgi:hypothetical protein
VKSGALTIAGAMVTWKEGIDGGYVAVEPVGEPVEEPVASLVSPDAAALALTSEQQADALNTLDLTACWGSRPR